MTFIQGIQFFHTPARCIANFEESHWAARAMSTLTSYANLLRYVVYKIGLKLRGNEIEFSQVRPFAKKRLVVCLHGLNGSPAQYTTILEELQKKDLKETDIFVPRICKAGNAKLDEMVQPILSVISEWAKTSGEKHLVLVGISNGGRIVKAVESKLDQNIRALHVVAIVGAWRGSRAANLVNRLGLSWLISKNISEEMPTDSKRMEQLNNEWQTQIQQLPTLRREYTFIASPHDWQVPNYDSTLPEVASNNVRYALVPGHGHNSIVNASSKAIAEIIFARSSVHSRYA
jgi:pimeloyl-ACP methyl ester carboxylesterase